MSNTQELKAAVSKLSAGDLNEFTEWFEEFIVGHGFSDDFMQNGREQPPHQERDF